MAISGATVSMRQTAGVLQVAPSPVLYTAFVYRRAVPVLGESRARATNRTVVRVLWRALAPQRCAHGRASTVETERPRGVWCRAHGDRGVTRTERVEREDI